MKNRGTYDILPPITKDPYHFHDQHLDHDGLYHIPQEEFKLPEVPKNSLHIPKTYSTKRGALLLYSEGCSVPGSRRLKKRPRFKRQKEERLQTLKDLMELIMDYKKNGVIRLVYFFDIVLNYQGAVQPLLLGNVFYPPCKIIKHPSENFYNLYPLLKNLEPLENVFHTH